MQYLMTRPADAETIARTKEAVNIELKNGWKPYISLLKGRKVVWSDTVANHLIEYLYTDPQRYKLGSYLSEVKRFPIYFTSDNQVE